MENNGFLDVNSLKNASLGTVRCSADENYAVLKNAFDGSFDINMKKGICGDREVLFVNCDGLTNSKMIAENAVMPLLCCSGKLPRKDTVQFICENLLFGTELSFAKSLDDAVKELLRGVLLIFIEGESECILFGAQNIPERSISEPDTEVQEAGSREGFVENMKTNLALIRKRLCTTDLRVETLEIGVTGKTRVCICYMSQKVSDETLCDVRRKLKSVQLDTLLGAGYLRKALDSRRPSFFTMVGQTQRPDSFCAKLNEGKVGIIVDGTPFTLLVPRLFIENFQTMDDYLNRPYFAAFMRCVRLLSFIISVFLPGIFVAVGLFHQELLPDNMLYNIVLMESNTLFNLTSEGLIIHFVYEAVREAGLRMPKSVGHAVSIVGALVIGDAAVSAGLIGAPMLIIVALTAICSLVSSDLYQPISVLRIVFILIGGGAGLYGITVGAAFMVINLASVTDYGVNFLSPFTPYDKSLWRDTIYRADMQKLGSRLFNINSLKGQDYDK